MTDLELNIERPVNPKFTGLFIALLKTGGKKRVFLLLFQSVKKNRFTPKMSLINIDALRKIDLGLSPGMANFMSECVRQCFSTNKHQSGVTMTVTTNSELAEEITVCWRGENPKQFKYCMNDEEKTTDFGAMGLTLLLLHKMTEYKYYLTASQEMRFDFWLFKEEPDELDYTKASALLEVTGIRTGNKQNNITKRLWNKRQQLSHVTSDFTVCISIIEFNKPESAFEWT